VSCPQGQGCSTTGTCAYVGNTYAGSPCATNADCTLGGVLGQCNTGNSWPGGYCQDTCYLLSCHGTDVCVSQSCWARCPGPRSGQSTCRGGYVCGALVFSDGTSPPYGICQPDCRVAGCTQGTCGPLGDCQ
jgi:serine protease